MRRRSARVELASRLFAFALVALWLSLGEPGAQVSAPVLMWQYGGCTSWCQTGWYASPAVADLDADGQPDVIWGSYDLVALNGATGGLKWRAANANRVWPGVALADLTGDGTLEVIVGRAADQLTVYNAAGSVLWVRNPFGSGELRTLAVTDLENDGQLEVVAGHAGSSTYQLNVFAPNGTVRTGWPARHAGEPGFGIGLYNENVAIADMNGDGFKELFAPTSAHYITALDRNGNQLPVNGIFAPRQVWSEVGVHVDHSVDLRGFANCGVEHRPNFQDSAPVVADVNGDGVRELIVVGNIQNCATYENLYHVPFIFKLDRTRWSGSGFDWTVLPAPSPGSAARSVDWNVIEIAVPNAVVADLDGDGLKEIVYPSYDGRVHAYWLDKTEHGSWPYTVPTSGASGDEFRFAGEPIVVDLENDGRAEVIFTSWPNKASGRVGQLHILSHLGVELHRVSLPAPGFSATWNGGLAAPTIANIDTDADLELVVGTASSGAVAYKLPNTANARVLWGTGRGNFGRTGTLTVAAPPPPPGDTTPPTVALTSPAGGATVSGTVTVAAGASDNVAVAGVQFFVDGAPLGAEDTTAPYSVAWDTTTAADGSHTLTARARDTSGNNANSSPVTVTSSNGTATQAVVWTSTVNVTVTANSIEKTGGCNTCDDAGAISTQQLTSGDGYVEFTIPLTTKQAFAGLSNGNTDTSRGDIDFALKFNANATVEVRENNLWQAATTFAANDVFRVAVVGGQVKYSRNGVVFYTSTKAPLYPLLLDTSLQDLNVKINNAIIPGTPPPPPSDTTAPTVSLTSPTGGATVSGTVTVAANASDDVGVAGVRFFLDGTTAIGVEDTTAPFQVTWDTTTVVNGSHTLTAQARDAAGNTGTSALVTVTVSNAAPDTTAPTVAITSPAGGTTVSGTVTVAASASDDVSVAGVRFFLDGAAFGVEDTTAPFQVTWDTTIVVNGSHTLTAQARDAAGNTGTSAPVTVTVSNAAPDTTPPTVAITSPADGATVAGTVTVAASASDDVGVAGVRFFVDGTAIGVEDTTAPYEVAWDTTTVTDAVHTLTAVARDAAGNTTTSAPITVSVANAAAAPTRFEETAATLSPEGAWLAGTSADFGVPLSGDRAAFSNTTGATATFTFTGTGVSWLGMRCETCGIARVSLDGTVVGTIDTFAPARSADVLFTRTAIPAGTHTLVIEVTGTANASSGGTFLVVDAFDVRSDTTTPPPSDTTAPTVAITAPAGGATVAGMVTVAASASDNAAVAGVRFFADGTAIGVEDTTAPYEVGWDTTTVTDGSHTLTAVARDTSGNTATSAPITVTVANGAPPTRFEEGAASLAPVVSWFFITDSTSGGVTLSGGQAAVAADPGATATFTFTGTRVAWLGFACEVCGIANVRLDGTLVATVDTFAAIRPATSQVMWTSATMAAGSHTLTIEVTGTANAASGNTFIVVDAVDVAP